MSEVVRQRLEVLLAEVRPRHALPEEARGAESVAGSLSDEAVQRPDTARGFALPASPSPARRLDEPGGGVARLGDRLVEFGREHLAAVVIVLLVGCGWTAYSLLQARSTPIAVAAAPTVVASPSPTPSSTPKVLVHVVGAVRSPGLVELPQGSRVADAIAGAGGLDDRSDPGELNLAAVVEDGSQVVIGTRSKPGGEVRGASGQSGSGSGGGSGTVSLNSATLDQLDTLPGVGPVTAQKILDWRKAHGRFSAVSELQEVDGIGPKTYADIAPHVRV